MSGLGELIEQAYADHRVLDEMIERWRALRMSGALAAKISVARVAGVPLGNQEIAIASHRLAAATANLAAADRDLNAMLGGMQWLAAQIKQRRREGGA